MFKTFSVSNDVNISAYSFHLVSIKEYLDQIMTLIRSHFNEISYHTDFELDVNKDFYFDMEDMGSLKLFIVKFKDQIVGYSTYFIARHNHCKIIQAHQDAIYLSPDFRKLGLGYKLINYADELFKGMGVSVVFQAMSSKYNFENTLNKLDYKLVDKLYARRL